jgi:hypothetical protein
MFVPRSETYIKAMGVGRVGFKDLTPSEQNIFYYLKNSFGNMNKLFIDLYTIFKPHSHYFLNYDDDIEDKIVIDIDIVIDDEKYEELLDIFSNVQIQISNYADVFYKTIKENYNIEDEDDNILIDFLEYIDGYINPLKEISVNTVKIIEPLIKAKEAKEIVNYVINRAFIMKSIYEVIKYIYDIAHYFKIDISDIV